MAVFTYIDSWIPETNGESLFLRIYQFVAPKVPPLFQNENWIVSPDGVTEHCRLMASMELTHRCLNTAVSLYELNPSASLDALIHRLRLVVGLQHVGVPIKEIAQSTRLAALDYIGRKLTSNQTDEIHKTEPKYCCWCGNPTVRRKHASPDQKATVEHLWPEFLGGTSVLENLTIACGECNSTRKHAFNWSWFSAQSVNEKLDKNGKLPREILLSIALHRLIKVASGKTALSAKRTSLKDAAKKLMGAIPKMNLACDTRYTFFEILHNSEE